MENLQVVVICAFIAVHVKSQVVDLDNSFSETRGDHPYLVEFYAPWCGHCRKLEPTYHQVYLELKHSPITVAKVDATKFTQLAFEYKVHGYPTIKFIHSDRVFTHNGERTKEGIVEFAKRAFGPHVRQLTSVGKLSEAKSEHAAGAFFIYIGPLIDSEKLYVAYRSVAEKHPLLSYFYSAASSNVLPTDMVVTGNPAVIVLKDGTVAEFSVPVEIEDMEESLYQWVIKERFVAFPKVSGVGLNEMASLGKLLAIFVLDDKDSAKVEKSGFKDIADILCHDDRYHSYRSHYQLVWMTDAEVASNIIMSSITSPFLFVLNPQTHEYYLLDESTIQQLTVDAVVDFFDSISNGSRQAYGGTGLARRFQRLGYDIKTTIIAIFSESPWVAVVVFGVPTFVISLVCYAICCLAPADDDDTRPSSDDEADDSEAAELMDNVAGGGDEVRSKHDKSE